MNEKEYLNAFAEPPREATAPKEADTRAGRALSLALDIRKFEIELYWKRATYFWAFIAAAFAAYALTYKGGTQSEPWLSILFSSLGFVFASAWYLVNKGSKFWQNNWERHVDMLEGVSLGPLYKVVATSRERNPLTAAGPYSVTKLNQLLSLYVAIAWAGLVSKEVWGLVISNRLDCATIGIVGLSVAAVVCLAAMGRSRIGHGTSKLTRRTYGIET